MPKGRVYCDRTPVHASSKVPLVLPEFPLRLLLALGMFSSLLGPFLDVNSQAEVMRLVRASLRYWGRYVDFYSAT